MKTQTKYKQAKNELLQVSKDAKKQYKNDKPAIRQIINDHTDYLCKNGYLSEYQQILLQNYACTLHPKN